MNLENRIAALNQAQRNLLLHKISGLQAGTTTNGVRRTKQLLAFIVPKPGFNLEVLKEHLKGHLPSYMIPENVYMIDMIPRLPNGKVDKLSLGAYVKSAKTEIPTIARSNDREKILVKIWEDVLGFAPIRPTDNFFEIGGDSILSIQIIARARNEGIPLKPNDLFENQSIAELADLKRITELGETAPLPMQGEIPLTPIQYWFFERQHPAPHFWNQVAELTNVANLSGDLVERVIRNLVRHHQGLRLAYYQDKEQWKARLTPMDPKAYFIKIALNAEGGPDSQQVELHQIIKEEQENSSLQSGHLFRAFYFDCGGVQPDRIFLVAHHLLVDAVSWEVLLADINIAVKQLNKGQKIQLHAPKYSVKDWWTKACEIVDTQELLLELPYWKAQCRGHLPLPFDFNSAPSVFREDTIDQLEFHLDTGQSNLLLEDTHAAYNTKTEDLLVAALCTTICDWTGKEIMGLGMERMGRKLYKSEIDISGTTGWFTSFFPLSLKRESGNMPESNIISVKEQLREIPHNGIGYGLLRYIHPDLNIRAQLSQEPQIVFNYLGMQNSPANSAEIGLVFTADSARAASGKRTHAIEINTYIRDGLLYFNLSYARQVFRKSTMETIGENFIKNLLIITLHCTNKKHMGYTPSDFPDAGISQDELDNLLRNF